jgi:hypothetical protein
VQIVWVGGFAESHFLARVFMFILNLDLFSAPTTPFFCARYLHLELTMGSKFYTIRFKDQIRLGSDSISIYFWTTNYLGPYHFKKKHLDHDPLSSLSTSYNVISVGCRRRHSSQVTECTRLILLTRESLEIAWLVVITPKHKGYNGSGYRSVIHYILCELYCMRNGSQYVSEGLPGSLPCEKPELEPLVGVCSSLL